MLDLDDTPVLHIGAVARRPACDRTGDTADASAGTAQTSDGAVVIEFAFRAIARAVSGLTDKTAHVTAARHDLTGVTVAALTVGACLEGVAVRIVNSTADTTHVADTGDLHIIDYIAACRDRLADRIIGFARDTATEVISGGDCFQRGRRITRSAVGDRAAARAERACAVACDAADPLGTGDRRRIGDRTGRRSDGAARIARNAARILSAVDGTTVADRICIACNGGSGLTHDAAGIIPAGAGGAYLLGVGAIINRAGAVTDDTAHILPCAGDRAVVGTARDRARALSRNTTDKRSCVAAETGGAAACGTHRADIRFVRDAADRNARCELRANNTAYAIGADGAVRRDRRDCHATRNRNVLNGESLIIVGRVVVYAADCATDTDATADRTAFNGIRALECQGRCAHMSKQAAVIVLAAGATDRAGVVTDVLQCDGSTLLGVADDTTDLAAADVAGRSIVIRLIAFNFNSAGHRVTKHAARVVAADRSGVHRSALVGDGKSRTAHVTDDTTHARAARDSTGGVADGGKRRRACLDLTDHAADVLAL